MIYFSPSWGRVINVNTYNALATACQNALPNDTIIVAAGTYTITGASRIMITSRPGPVLVKGATGNPADVIIQGQGQDNPSVQMVFNLDYSPQWTFENITTRNSYYHGFKFDHNSTDCILRKIVMRDHGESGVKGTSDPSSDLYPDRLLVDQCDIGFTNSSGGTRSVVEGVDGVGVNDWIIRRSVFMNIQKSGNPATAIFTKGNSSNTIIEQNVFYNCFIGASFGGGGTAPQYFRNNDMQYEHRNGIIRNNVMIRTTDAGIYINKGKSCKIYNNTVFECYLTIQLRYVESTGYVRNNLVKPSPNNSNEPIIRLRDGATMLANEANLLAVNSYFVQPVGSDNQLNLHLKQGTAPVDGGVNVNPDVTNDYDGNNRPAGNAYDVGAYEYGAVPVELSSFRAERIEKGILVQWKTETETNNSGFDVERNVISLSKVWEKIGFVQGHGTVNTPQSYSFIDQIVEADRAIDTLWYRLRQNDFDGGYELSPIISVLISDQRRNQPTLEQNFPNPFSNTTVICFAVPNEADRAHSFFKIYNLCGEVIQSFTVDSFGDNKNAIELHAHPLNTGLYFYELQTPAGVLRKPMMIIK